MILYVLLGILFLVSFVLIGVRFLKKQDPFGHLSENENGLDPAGNSEFMKTGKSGENTAGEQE